MRRDVRLWCLGVIFALGFPVAAQECSGAPAPETLQSAEKTPQLIDNGFVQFGGYLAMVSYAKSRDDCVKAGVFEDLYMSALDAMPESKMLIWKEWSVSPLDFSLSAASAVEGFGGSCRIKFDLPQAGPPENVRVSCDNPMIKSSFRRAWKKLIFAPRTLNEGFKTAKDLEYEIDLEQRIEIR